MMFTGNEDHSISLEDASALTANFRNSAGQGAVLGGYFSKTIIQDLLDQQDCVGLRYYYGKDNDGVPQLVISGVNAAGEDLYNGALGNRSMPCPPYCGPWNPLNRQSG